MSHAEARQDRLTDAERLRWEVLAALATYQLMTARLMLAAGVGHDLRRVREAAQWLVRNALVGYRTARELDHPTVRDAVYWLKPAGAAELARADGRDVATSRRDPKFPYQLEHKLDIVRCHLALRQWAASAGVVALDVVQDFDAGGPSGFKATTTALHDRQGAPLPYLPDALAKLTLPDGTRRLLAFEVERGGYDADLYAFRRRKLPHLAEVLAAGAELAAVYEVAAPVLLLVVFQHDAMREGAVRLWQQPQTAGRLGPASWIWDSLLMKSLAEIQRDFFGGWWQAGDRPRRSLFSEGLAAV